jgi:L-seryl-tRNA(Ser) seleniumtransferase
MQAKAPQKSSSDFAKLPRVPKEPSELPSANAALLRALPRVDDLILRLSDAFPSQRRHEISRAARRAIAEFRNTLLAGNYEDASPNRSLGDAVFERAAALLSDDQSPRRVLNGTGIIIHTGLGRSLLSRSACEAITRVALSHNALEVDIESGERGRRDARIAALLREITGCEDATIVNNCAGATLLILSALAAPGEVLCSRGELVEIGGGFRMPDVMRQSGCTLREVGTTNKTRFSDYEAALNDNSRALLKVHTSNFRIVGFTEEVPLPELVKLGRAQGISVIEDLGSGVLVDLAKAGLRGEPRVQESVAAGADAICFSGDKLLGGPQCGLIVGRRDAIETIRRHPLTRALRVDKFTLAALEATLRHYLDEDEAWREIPTLRALSESVEIVKARAQKLARGLRGLKVEIKASQAQAGAGALPTQTVPSFAVTISLHGIEVQEFARCLRQSNPSVWGRIHEGALWLDCRTLRDDEIKECARVVLESLPV